MAVREHVVFYTLEETHAEDLRLAIKQEIGLTPLHARSWSHFLELRAERHIVGCVFDLSVGRRRERNDARQEIVRFREWASRTATPTLILTDEADFAERDNPSVFWAKFSQQSSDWINELSSKLAGTYTRHTESSVAFGVPTTEEQAKNSFGPTTSSILDLPHQRALTALVIGAFPLREGLDPYFATILHAATLDDVRSHINASRPHAVLLAGDHTDYQALLELLRFRLCEAHTCVAIHAPADGYQPEISQAQSLIFHQNTPWKFVLEQVVFAARHAASKRKKIFVVTDSPSSEVISSLTKQTWADWTIGPPRECLLQNPDTIVVLDDAADDLELENIRARATEESVPFYALGPKHTAFPKNRFDRSLHYSSLEELSYQLESEVVSTQLRTHIAHQDQQTGSNHWLSFRPNLASHLRRNRGRGTSIVAVEIIGWESFSARPSQLQRVILRQVVDHLWNFFGRSTTYRAPLGRFMIIANPLDQAREVAFTQHLKTMRSQTIRDDDGRGVYVELKAAHLKVPPGEITIDVCEDALARVLARLSYHSESLLHAELDSSRLVRAPSYGEDES